MADELNIPTHRYYEPRNNIKLAKEDVSAQYIYDSGIQKLNAWTLSQPWGNPAVLFGTTDTGWVYDLSDMSTLFQDAAGTTPVTAVGQPVGLQLDKSRGLVLGPELVTNGVIGIVGTATAATYSTLTGVGTVSRVDASNQSFVRWSSLNSNGIYKVRVTCTSGNISIRAGDVTAAVLQTLTAGQTFDGYFVPVGGFFTVTHAPVVGTSGFTVTSVRELPGNHRRQSTALNRPTYARHPLGGIRNLLTYSEQFDNAVWTKTGVTVTANAIVAPDGTTTAEKVTVDTANSFHRLAAPTQNLSATSHTLSVYMKAAEYTSGGLSLFDGSVFTGRATFDLSAGTVAITNGTATITSVGNGWYRCTVTGNGSATTSAFISVNSVFTFTGDGTSGILIWGAQLEVGSTATAYQRVGSAFDVTEAGVEDLYYLSYDGINDSLATASFAWGTDKATVVAGVRKLSDAALGMVAEYSANVNTNNGSWHLLAPTSAGVASSGFWSKGTIASGSSAAGFAAPASAVISVIGDIAGDTSLHRRNGAQVSQGTANQGTGNYGTYPVYFGARGGTSLFFNGREYSNVGINRLLTTGELAALESWTAGKNGVTLP